MLGKGGVVVGKRHCKYRNMRKTKRDEALRGPRRLFAVVRSAGKVMLLFERPEPWGTMMNRIQAASRGHPLAELTTVQGDVYSGIRSDLIFISYIAI
jgi:hypothetical protein